MVAKRDAENLMMMGRKVRFPATKKGCLRDSLFLLIQKHYEYMIILRE